MCVAPGARATPASWAARPGCALEKLLAGVGVSLCSGVGSPAVLSQL